MGVTLSAVVPVWNGRAHLARLLHSMEGQQPRFDEVVVVDNGSTDGAGDYAASQGARVVRFSENRGFAAAVNRGVAESAGERVAILNSDVELGPQWTEQLMPLLERYWFSTGLILAAQNHARVDGTWDLVSQAGMPWRVGSGATAASAVFQRGRPIEMASFTAILIRRALWERVGELDERFETYLEDVDFGVRCAAARCGGYFEPRAVCFHEGSATLGRWNRESVRRMSRNQELLSRKYIAAERWGWRQLCGRALWGLVAARHGAGAAWLTGKWEAWRTEGPAAAPVDPWFFERQEAELLALQRTLGEDAYWKWYRRLTRKPGVQK